MSNETKWTKGPWKVFTPEDYSGPNELPGLGVDAESGEAVVWYCDCPETGLGNDADAHLIATAPELYDALKVAHDNLYALINDPEIGPEVRKLYDLEDVAAMAGPLAKARGEQS